MTKKRFLAMAAVLAIHLIVIFFYGMQKEAFHEDEYYTYYTSAGYEGINPYGPILEKSGMEIQSHFFVIDAHRFDFANVVRIQEIDVHPPLYYMTLHFVMSLFPYSFYKWFGILLNSCYSLMTCGGIIFFIFRLDKSRHRCFLALLGGLLYAVHPAMISDVMFTRMYSMSVMWTILYMDVFVVLMQNLNGSRKRFALLTLCGAAICYCAFLTHYFCLYLLFLLTLGFCIYALVRKLIYKEKCFVRMLVYGLSMTAAIGLAICTFPTSLEQIFANAQGEDAFATLLSPDLFAMFRLFLPVMNKNFFSGLMYPVMGILAAALLAGVIMLAMRRRRGGPAAQTNFAILGIALAAGLAGAYLLSRSSLYMGDASSRYFYTAAAQLLPLIAYSICKVVLYAADGILAGRDIAAGSLYISGGRRGVSEASGSGEAKGKAAAGKRGSASAEMIVMAVLTALVLLPALLGHAQGNVQFLYRDKVETLQYARDNAQYPLVMIYDQDTRFKTWYIANETWPYERIIFIRYDDEATVIENEALQTAEKLIVYMDGPEEILDRLVAQNKNLERWYLLRHDPNYYVYVLE